MLFFLKAYINVRKGKLIHGFMLSVDKIEWQGNCSNIWICKRHEFIALVSLPGEIKDADGNAAVECKGTCLLEEIDGTMDLVILYILLHLFDCHFWVTTRMSLKSPRLSSTLHPKRKKVQRSFWQL